MCLEPIIYLISRWLFRLCFPINRMYVHGISLLIWSHADCFSCVFLLTACMCLESIIDFISHWLFLMCLRKIHSLQLEEIRGSTPLVMKSSHCGVYVPGIHQWFDYILTVPFSGYIVSYMILWQLGDMRFMFDGWNICCLCYTFWTLSLHRRAEMSVGYFVPGPL